MKEIILSKGEVCLVDDDDFDSVSCYIWHLNKKGYAERGTKTNKKYKKILLHRVVNKTPDKLLTDHIDGNRLNNQKKNLRTVDHLLNNRNKSKAPSGAYLLKSGNWYSKISIRGKQIYLGVFSNRKLAESFFKKKREELWTK
jgi:hypothetical protein